MMELARFRTRDRRLASTMVTSTQFRRPKQSHLLHLVLVESPNGPRPREPARRAMVASRNLLSNARTVLQRRLNDQKKKKKGKKKEWENRINIHPSKSIHLFWVSFSTSLVAGASPKTALATRVKDSGTQ
jgi:hypothetical protein